MCLLEQVKKYLTYPLLEVPTLLVGTYIFFFQKGGIVPQPGYILMPDHPVKKG